MEATLSCSYDETAYAVFWYLQKPGKSPQFILQDFTKNEDLNEEYKDRFNANHDKATKQFPLSIKLTKITDSGTYLCAPQSNYRIHFGIGTRLLVRPNIKDVEPSMYRLKADRKQPEVPEYVCLATDLPVIENGTEFELNGESVDKDERILLDKTEDNTWRYSSVLWTDDLKTECTVNYGSKTIPETPLAEKEECSSPKIDETFKTDERLNTLSLKMLGLRFLTMKAIVFNVIITLRLWSA
uniref:Ig-like domain-containing protein n=1 Tax=Xenopus laevis TaxID=8355 RepID=Q5U4N2_XENLA|nr:Unknown (protein for MGC:98990) [Xenopus laevis]